MNLIPGWSGAPPHLKGLRNPSALSAAAFRRAIALDPERTVSEWADEHRVLSKKASAEPGRWSTDRTPYLREIMDALSPSSPTEEVVFQKPTQVGGTEAGNNWIGSIIDQALGPTMMVLPTSNSAKRTSRTRIGPMIQETPCLRGKVSEVKSRDAGNTVLMKEFDGGVLLLAGANSATELKSSPIRNLFLDEIEEYPLDVDGQGDPEELAEKRQDTFARRKRFKTSTPTIIGGRIDVAYKASDQRLYFVPCPHCKHEQTLRFERLRWETRKVWERTDRATGEVAAAEPNADGAAERDTGELLDVHYECESCHAAISEHEKTGMLAAGTWIAQNRGPDRSAGFKINALYSPLGWFSWRKVVLKWIDAERDTSGTKRKTFWNTVLGEAYEEAGEAIEAHWLKTRIEPGWRLSQVPPGCLLLTAGVDVQHNRLECYVWGWGRDLESWVIERIVIFGSPALDETWKALEDVLQKGYPHPGGTSIRISAMAIDSSDGVTTHFVRHFARKWSPTRRVIAVKGQSTAGKPIIGRPTKQDVNYRGQVQKQGVEIWPYGADTAKGALYARLKLERQADAPAGPVPGYVHIPLGLPDEFFDQLTSERRVTRYLRGHPSVEWVLPKGRNNEALDCAGMAHAAAEYAGPLSRINWDHLEKIYNPAQRELLGQNAAAPGSPPEADEPRDADRTGAAAPDAPPPVQTFAPGSRRRRGSFM